MEAIFASDLNNGFDQLWQLALEHQGPVYVLADTKEQLAIERQLTSKSPTGAFMHIRVMSLTRLALETFARHRKFKKRPFSHLEALVACLTCLKMEGLEVFGQTEVTVSFLEELVTCFEVLSDCPTRVWPEHISMLSQAKINDLEKMYKRFLEIKQEALFGGELYRQLIPLLQDAFVIFCLPRDASKSQQEFIRQVPGAYLELQENKEASNWQSCLLEQYHQLKPKPIANLPFSFHQFASKQDQFAYVIESIADHVLKGEGRYQDFCIYLENALDLADLATYANLCQVPLKADVPFLAPYVISYVRYYCEHILDLEKENIDQLYKIANQCVVLDMDLAQYEEQLKQDQYQLKQCKTTSDVEKILFKRWEILSSTPIKKLFDGWDAPLTCKQVLMFYQEMASLVSLAEDAKKKDRVYVTTYQQPYLARFFKHTYFLGLNEDIYPSRVKDSGLLLESELIHLYPTGTPKGKQTMLEKERMLWMIMLSSHSHFSCYRGALDGTTYLPSLLFNFLKQLANGKLASNQRRLITQANARYHGYLISPKEQQLHDEYEAHHYQPEPLPQTLTYTLYANRVSPSQLECFNGCPYQHFLRYGLHLNSPTKDENRRIMGILMHDLLDECALLFKGEFASQLESLCGRYQIEVSDLDTTLEALCLKMMERRRPEKMDAEMHYLWGIFPIQFLQSLKMLLSQASAGKFQLVYHEKALKDTLGEVDLVGRIDRGDVFEEYLKVLDYKSSGRTLDLDLAIQGFNIQMLVYLEMLSRQQKLKKGAVLYFNTALRKISSEEAMHLTVKDKLLVDFERSYKMQGWLVKDDRHQVMSGLDQNYTESRICNIRYVKSRDDYTGNLLTPASFDRLLLLVKKRMEEIVDECFKQGDIRIFPAGSVESSLKMKVSPCAFCAYRYVCMRDPFYHEDREIKALSKSQLEACLGEEEKE